MKVLTASCLALLLALLTACGHKESALRPQTGHLLVFSEDTCRNISYTDEPKFAIAARRTSLFYNGLALVDSAHQWGYIDEKGRYAILPRYARATVFSEGLAWVIKKGDMPGAINTKGDIRISLRDAVAVRVFQEGRAAFATTSKGITRWGFIDKNGKETAKPRFKAVGDYHFALAAVQDIKTGLWGYIDLSDSTRIPCRYNEALPFNEAGHALTFGNEGYAIIDREGNTVNTLPPYELIIPDGEWLRFRQNKKWGWCTFTGSTVIPAVYDDCRPFGSATLAPVLIRGKWAYIDREGKTAIKRQFTDAYPFIDGVAAVKAGTVWGFISPDGSYTVNPQYDDIPADYLNQSLGKGTVFSTLHISQ